MLYFFWQSLEQNKIQIVCQKNTVPSIFFNKEFVSLKSIKGQFGT